MKAGLVGFSQSGKSTLYSALTGLAAAAGGGRGKANLGDKTMVDALTPALTTLKAAAANGAGLRDALRQSEQAADQGKLDTIPLVARKGRASYLGERSAGHQDPGATSSHLLLKTVADIWG